MTINAALRTDFFTTDTPNGNQNKIYDFTVEPLCDVAFLLHLDPTSTTAFTVDAWPNVELNGVAVRDVANRPVLMARIDHIVLKVSKRVEADAAAGTVDIALTDAGGDFSITGQAVPAQFDFAQILTSLTSTAIDVTFAGGSDNLVVDILVVGCSTTTPGS